MDIGCSMTKTVALIQARMSSSRFPGKVLEPLAGEPMIGYMVNRARRASLLDDVIVVTSTDASDDPLDLALRLAQIPVFRGDLHDVLGRYAAAADACDADEIVRLTGDCPLIDPGVINAVISLRRTEKVGYASNVDPPSYPDGLDVECFTLELLKQARGMAVRPSEREHVTLWMRETAAAGTRANQKCVADLSAIRLTVDYPDDLALVRQIVAALPDGSDFDMYDVLRVLASHSDLPVRDHSRNEGLANSLANEIPSKP
jgi:spore coat polysaccharide biosynthesis protein SpsF